MISYEDYIIDAADLGACNPLPDLKNVSYIHAGYEMTDKITEEERRGIGKGMISTMLPYTLQDGYNRDRKPRVFKAVRLENEYLKAIFLPELGGRLWSLFDKEKGRELLYKNPVFQPANLALRNAWFSGGVEFNVGIKGHNPLTCSPLFAEIITAADGERILRMYEYERIREITYSISACLPAGSKLLYIQNCIENTSDDDKYSYWWSNIAVPEEKNTRIIVPADETFISSYNEGRYLVDKIPVPMYDGKDLSYPKNSVRAQDFFYKIPENEAKWIAAVQEDGYGLLQLSDRKMIGRKLFVWGQGQGGRHWGEWLSVEGQSYVEIQAGLAHTQLEHIPMKAGECRKWTEAYCAVDCGSSAHSKDWKIAQQAVKNAFCGNPDADAIEEMFCGLFNISNDSVTERLCDGSGWGALENITRRLDNKAPASRFCRYYESSLGEEQKLWLELINNGYFGAVSPLEEPKSYVSTKYFRSLLEKASRKNGSGRWYALLQLGVHYYIYGEIDRARDAWLESISVCKSAWAFRNLALLYKNEYGKIDKAIEYIGKAAALNRCRAILVDCAGIYTANGLDREWLSLFESLSYEQQAVGRLRLFKAIAHLNLGELDEARKIVNKDFIMYDIQEGEVSVSHIWKRLYKEVIRKETGITDEDRLIRLAAERYPLPRSLDFRMHE